MFRYETTYYSKLICSDISHQCVKLELSFARLVYRSRKKIAFGQLVINSAAIQIYRD